MESAGLSLRLANQRFEPQWMRSRAEKDVEPMMRDEDVRQPQALPAQSRLASSQSNDLKTLKRILSPGNAAL